MRTLKPGNRVGAVFLVAYLAPAAVLLAIGGKNSEGALLVVIPMAISVTALWWASSGYRLDAPTRPGVPRKRR